MCFLCRCALMQQVHPDWSDERLYQEARAWVIALIQRITMEEVRFLSILVMLCPHSFTTSTTSSRSVPRFSIFFSFYAIIPAFLSLSFQYLPRLLARPGSLKYSGFHSDVDPRTSALFATIAAPLLSLAANSVADRMVSHCIHCLATLLFNDDECYSACQQ